jgi:hypothetical protein
MFVVTLQEFQAAKPSWYQAVLGLMTNQYDIQGYIRLIHTCKLWENSGSKQSIFFFIAFANNLSLSFLFPNGKKKEMRT